MGRKATLPLGYLVLIMRLVARSTAIKNATRETGLGSRWAYATNANNPCH